MTIEQLYDIYIEHPAISTDTRKIAPGSIFFALKGDKFDANTFAGQAIAAGAAYAVIDDAAYQTSAKQILVDDVLTTLQGLAKFHRSQLKIPVIGLTGSNGKTTTKELINAVLSQHYITYATKGNLNNHIGVPLSLLAIKSNVEIAIIEMGANHQQEIEHLSNICQPTHGLITNIGLAHLEGFGGREGVKKGKGELFDYLKANHGTAFVNADSAVLLEMAKGRQMTDTIYYGSSEHNAVSGSLLQNAPLLKLRWKLQGGEYHIAQSHLTGVYNLDNILAAICIGHYFKLRPGTINRGIESYLPTNNRSQIIKTATNTLICDYYNANPSSMSVAIENMRQLDFPHKILILGDMFELGDESQAEHAGIMNKAMDIGADECIFIGEEFYRLKGSIAATFYRLTDDAIAALKTKPITNATVLIKGSRGMALEGLVELL